MSGTEELNNNQPGAETKEKDIQPGAEIQSLKEQISELRKEAAKYRTAAKSNAGEKQSIEEQLKALQDEFAKTKKENQTVKRTALLDKAGCIKSDLVVNIIPEYCDDIEAWIKEYKKENEVLFKQEIIKHGGGYKPSSSNNLSPSQVMNSFIRTAAGR